MSIPELKLHDRKSEWWTWHKLNPDVWRLFERFTLQAISSGREHYSAWAVIQRIRWHTTVETSGSDFKISNDYIAFYARLFHVKHPEYDGFFRTKKLKEEKEMAFED
jgi:hypothetical protein